MEISTALLIAAIVACPLAMGAMMWMMNRQMKERSHGSSEDTPSPAARLGALRRQEEGLQAEVRELERVVKLEGAGEPSVAGRPSPSSVADRGEER